MKKILAILFSFLLIGLIGCIVVGFCQKIDVNLLSGVVLKYKLSKGLLLFTQILPALIFSGFAISCSIQFGRNSEGSQYRFSKSMITRFKTVMIVSLICTLILTLSTEVVSLTMKRNLENYANQPQIVNDYIKVGNNFLKQGKPEAAAVYAKEALTLDPSNEKASMLKDEADKQISINDANTSHLIHENAIDSLFVKKEDSDINKEKLSEVFELYKKSKAAYENEEWFNAHYYAETALKIASGKDPNVAELKNLSATAWNNLTELHKFAKNGDLTDEQKLFNQKYEGYKALMQEDYLTAYYILKNIQLTHEKEVKNDTDLAFYINIAEKKVEERNFFIDETFELKSFESANNIYFSLKYDDGWTDIIYFKGMTQVKTSGGIIQYLRALTIETLDSEGQFVSSMTVPYAKVFKVSVKEMNPLIKDSLGISRDIDSVPYILLRGVDRYNDNAEAKPVYTYADKEKSGGPDYIMLKMSFNDFQMIESASVNPETIPIGALYKILKKAENFGYSPEVYGQVLLGRILYPMFILIAFILLASLAWNNRLDTDRYFKAIWVLILPIFSGICYALYQIVEIGLKLIIFAAVELTNVDMAFLLGFGTLIIVLFFSSLIFLGRKASK